MFLSVRLRTVQDPGRTFCAGATIRPVGPPSVAAALKRTPPGFSSRHEFVRVRVPVRGCIRTPVHDSVSFQLILDDLLPQLTEGSGEFVRVR